MPTGPSRRSASPISHLRRSACKGAGYRSGRDDQSIAPRDPSWVEPTCRARPHAPIPRTPSIISKLNRGLRRLPERRKSSEINPFRPEVGCFLRSQQKLQHHDARPREEAGNSFQGPIRSRTSAGCAPDEVHRFSQSSLVNHRVEAVPETLCRRM